MILSYSLNKGEYFGNYTTDYSLKNFILFQKAKVTVTAEIIQSLDTNFLYSDSFVQSLKLPTSKEVFLSHGDSVVVINSNKLVSGKIIELDSKKATICFSSQSKLYRFSKIPVSDCYKVSHALLEEKYMVKAGEHITFKVVVDKDLVERKGLVVCMNQKGVVVNSGGRLQLVEPNKIKKANP